MILQIPSGVRVLVPHVSVLEIELFVIILLLTAIFLILLEFLRDWKNM